MQRQEILNIDTFFNSFEKETALILKNVWRKNHRQDGRKIK